MVQDLLGEGADEGFPVEWAVVVFLGALDDVVDVEGCLSGKKYVIYYIHIRLTFRLRRSGFAVFGAAEGAQGAELSQCRVFQDFNEVVSIQWVHRAKKIFVMGHKMQYE